MRFRNHFSIVLPNLKGILWLILMAVLSAVLQENKEEVVVTVLTWIAIMAIVLIWQILVWARTWITIGQNSIVIEQNTWFIRKKNTIGIANISNVNLEQGLFAMLIGTCKLKLDTNSLSTADATDVKIVLKKNEAEHLRVLLMARISGEEVQNTQEMCPAEVRCADNKADNKICVNGADILWHGILSARFLYAIFIPLFVIFEFITEMDKADIHSVVTGVENFAAETVGLTVFILGVVGLWILVATGFGLVRNSIKYWDFQIERKEQKLILEYGLTKKVNYSIPVDKIQAVVVKQSCLARMFGRYMVEVVNVGIKDEEKETQAFLLPYSNRKFLVERMQMLLPEFAHCLELKVQRQPKGIWVVWLWPVLIYLLIMGGILTGVAEYLPEILGMVCGGIVVLSVVFFVVKLMSYHTKGTGFGKEVLLAVTGSFSRNYVYMKYRNIQHIMLKQSFLAKRFGIQRGVVLLLASGMNQAQEIPYFCEKEIEKIKERLLK